MEYIKVADWISSAVALDASSITVELDSGEITFCLEDALTTWSELAPGEPFTIISINA